jgi:NAD(P)-dependent dehydrogenase (short-subunit alcohol dehydrogenase family)
MFRASLPEELVAHAQTMTPRWALILGASSGFGEACARALAAAGYDIAGVHLDRKAGLEHVREIQADIEGHGRRHRFFNMNAADEGKRREVVDAMATELADGGTIAVLMHSLAFGTLKPYVAEDALTKANIEMTLDVMAHSLVYWAQDVVSRGLMARGGRIFAMTSSGSTRVIPSYGAVSAAKCALESHIRQLATELASRGVTANALRGGVTNTPAARKIPGSERLFAEAARRNPHGRITTPEDVARAVVALSAPQADWITGNVINVDGGEEVSGG